MTTANQFDFVIVGGGIVGLATAWNLSRRFPDATLCLIEKESRVGAHQSGRNSGVLHSGIYYKPGSLKAITCQAGKRAMEAFCQEEGIRYEVCGKIIVAVSDDELGRLEAQTRTLAEELALLRLDVRRLDEQRGENPRTSEQEPDQDG